MYVIIGATGNTGSVVASKLLAHGKKVRVVGRNAEHLAQFKGAEPFVGDVTDKDSMSKAFAGAQAVYLMIPPNPTAVDYRGNQRQVSEAFEAALEKNGTKFAVVLSSFGADKPDKTGPILGLRELEERLNRISGLNALYLRPGYFMENTLGQAGVIKQMGVVASPLHPELKFPLIATRDIGAYAADVLSRLNFTGHQAQELLGPRDVSYADITAIIGDAITKPTLSYVRLTSDQFHGVLTQQLGTSKSYADLLTEMVESMNSGYLRPLEARSERSTTPTSYETFVAEELVPLYRGEAAA